uniref:Uncharacterized protein n=1 Tax=Globodera rostochiensis TaxID=31243 RepID=A0A914I712_GLORO
MFFNTPWSPSSPPGYQAILIHQEVDGLRHDLSVLLHEEEEPEQQQQQQHQQPWQLYPVETVWLTPRSHRVPRHHRQQQQQQQQQQQPQQNAGDNVLEFAQAFERPVPQRTPSPSNGAPFVHALMHAQPSAVAPTVVEGTLIFSDQCLLCRSDHDSSGNNGGSQVVHRGNNCLCVMICEACVTNGWWQQYVASSAQTAALAIEANLDPYTGLPNEDPESYRNWVEAHDVRPRCLRCHAQRVDFLFPVTRPRRTQRVRSERQCSICRRS